jgi:membrane protease YdiL (CAAX protease family)
VNAQSTPDPDDDPRTGGSRAASRPHALAAALALTAVAFVVSLAGGVAFVIPVVLFGLDVASPAVFLGLTAAGQVGFLAVAAVYARRTGLRVRAARFDARDAGYAVAGTVAALALAVGLVSLLSLAGLVPESALGEAVSAEPRLLLGLAALSVVLVAPAEEFLFRGVVQTRLRRAFGPVGAVAGASLLFGALHLGNYVGSVVPVVAGALLISAVGSVFGLLYERTDNLAVPVAAHAAYNVVLFGVAFVGV